MTMLDRWKDIIKAGDPFYNPNLSLIKESYTLKSLEEIEAEIKTNEEEL